MYVFSSLVSESDHGKKRNDKDDPEEERQVKKRKKALSLQDLCGDDDDTNVAKLQSKMIYSNI
jgi:hypothetical protein